MSPKVCIYLYDSKWVLFRNVHSFSKCESFSKWVLFRNVHSFSKCSSFSKCAFILKMGSFSKCAFILKMWKLCERFREFFFHLSKKHNCKQSQLTKVCKTCIVYSKCFWWGRVKYDEIYKALEFVSVVRNL